MRKILPGAERSGPQSTQARSLLSGQYFVFVNRRKTQMKMLYFTPTGYCLWAKRLEQGQFRVRLASALEDPVRR
ncbi:hypothetical protein SSTU70S_02724 [Stutzerimonas stutzeri]